MLNKNICQQMAFLLISCVISVTAFATESEALATLLENNRNIEGTFLQTTYDEDGFEQQKSAGVFTLAQPNRFVWDTESPFPQKIVSNGKTITIWDIDLEQASQKSFHAAVGNSPAALLSQPANEVLPHYSINQLDSEEFELIPNDTEGLFAALTLAFQKGVIRVMKIKDTLGQVTVIEFNKLALHNGVESARFELQLPADVDLIVEGQ